ncbi:MAG: 3-phosphoshikimate 1-carboxyvinyltransferase [Alistipes sp.]|nr:3-phosphoshikimate 1-carboxyvinyltransferase [Alistipes sp.]
MELFCPKGRLGGKIKAPASKSYAQRGIAAALLSEGTSVVRNMELCNDTAAALDVAAGLGARITATGQNRYTVEGGSRAGRLVPRERVVSIGESGLSARMFTPIASLCTAPVTITGEGSILKRPLGMMTAPLESLGVRICSKEGFLPVTVEGPPCGGEAVVDGSMSSQFLTGLLMALPLAARDTVLTVENATSRPYLDMTLDILQKFGIEITNREHRRFEIPGGQKYRPRTYEVEGDWSGASCLLVAGAIAGCVTIGNIDAESCQADVAILDALRRAGARVEIGETSVTVCEGELTGFRFDATDCPDLFPALVTLAACCRGKTVLKGTSRLKHKESDRAAALKQEFGKMGIPIDITVNDTMTVEGGRIRSAAVSSHNDHRIAMAAAVAALRSEEGIAISGADAVNKSYPGFWQDLESLRIG